MILFASKTTTLAIKRRKSKLKLSLVCSWVLAQKKFDIMIHLTESAEAEIKRMQASSQQLQSYFRLAIKEGGCSGWYYNLELSQAVQAGDRTYTIAGIPVLLDSQSLPYLENMRLDYAEDLMGGGFRFYNSHTANPCNCGLSFHLNLQDKSIER